MPYKLLKEKHFILYKGIIIEPQIRDFLSEEFGQE